MNEQIKNKILAGIKAGLNKSENAKKLGVTRMTFYKYYYQIPKSEINVAENYYKSFVDSLFN